MRKAQYPVKERFYDFVAMRDTQTKYQDLKPLAMVAYKKISQNTISKNSYVFKGERDQAKKNWMNLNKVHSNESQGYFMTELRRTTKIAHGKQNKIMMRHKSHGSDDECDFSKKRFEKSQTKFIKKTDNIVSSHMSEHLKHEKRKL